MKRLFPFLVILALFAACTATKHSASHTARLAQVSGDSSQYEVLIDDPWFDQWYQVNYSPAKEYTNEFYRGRNVRAVATWNAFYVENKYNRVVDCRIDYRPEIDYGIEVNRKLYWYFRYVEQSYKVPVL